jgi:hypothetical protein
MGIATEKPFYEDLFKPATKQPWELDLSTVTNQRKKEYANVPMVVAPGHEEEYLAAQQEVKANQEAAKKKKRKVMRRWMWNQHRQKKPMSKSNKKVKRQLHRQLAIQMVGQDC